MLKKRLTIAAEGDGNSKAKQQLWFALGLTIVTFFDHLSRASPAGWLWVASGSGNLKAIIP